jgi:hypothetical protein
MNEKRSIVAVLLALTCVSSGYNANHGPFPTDAQIDRIQLTERYRYFTEENAESTTNLTFLISLEDESHLNLVWKDDLWFVELIIGGEVALESTAFSDFEFPIGLEAFSADLNRDGIVDYVLYSYSGGVGLAMGYCNVAFILSSEDGYRLVTIGTLWPVASNYVILNGSPCFIHTSFQRVERCKQGRNRNFWVYNLLAFEKGDLKLANDAHPDFPKTIWFSFRPNHEETTIITDEQIAELRKQSLQDIFWKPRK